MCPGNNLSISITIHLSELRQEGARCTMLTRSSRLLPRLQAACLRAVPHVQKLSTAVRVEDDEQSGVKVLTLDRPDSLNAMTVEMGDAVQASVAQLAQLPPSELRAPG